MLRLLCWNITIESFGLERDQERDKENENEGEYNQFIDNMGDALITISLHLSTDNKQ